MEEILASIRRIISEDNDTDARTEPVAPSATQEVEVAGPMRMDEDVLELTQMVKDDGSVVDVDEDWGAPPPAAEPQPQVDMDNLDDFFARPSAAVQEPDPAPRADFTDEDLVSPPAAAAASAAFAQLHHSLGGRSLPLHQGGPTLEDIVKDMLRPMMRDWLDENLPPLVERMVQREIEKMVRRAQGG
jgi:cell pole-organizing protein PopZ